MSTPGIEVSEYTPSTITVIFQDIILSKDTNQVKNNFRVIFLMSSKLCMIFGSSFIHHQNNTRCWGHISYVFKMICDCWVKFLILKLIRDFRVYFLMSSKSYTIFGSYFIRLPNDMRLSGQILYVFKIVCDCRVKISMSLKQYAIFQSNLLL